MNLGLMMNAGRLSLAMALVGALGTLPGCFNILPKESRPVAPAFQPNYKDLVQSADEASKSGDSAEAVTIYEKATRLEPARKEPWLRMAQLHFEARSYGLAIIAAQEVQMRDNTDISAKNILAASGLRVASRALDALRASKVTLALTLDEARAVSNMIMGLPDSDPQPLPLVPAKPKPVLVTPAPRYHSSPASPAKPMVNPLTDLLFKQ